MTNLKPDDTSIYLRLEAISPVHIGAGKESVSEMDYQIKDGYLHTLDINAWLSCLPEDRLSQVSNIMCSSTPDAIKSFLQLQNDLLENFSTSQTRIMGKPGKTINFATRNPLTQAMLIPGSSIKGAIRTALMDHLFKAWELPKFKAEGVFGDIKDNALQALKVSDFEMVPNESIWVLSALRYSIAEKDAKDKTEKRNISRLSFVESFEVCPPKDLGEHKEVYGRIRLGNAKTGGTFLACVNKEYSRCPPELITFSKLASICSTFYKKNFESEKARFYSNAHFSQATKQAISSLEKQINTIGENTFLLRVGHFSHRECLTLEHAQADGITRRLQNPSGEYRGGQYPFGWVLLHKVTLEEYQEGMHAQEVARQAIAKEQQAKRAYFIAQAGEQEKAQKEAKKREEVRKLQEAQEEENRKKVEAELAAMPEIVRLCIQIPGLPLEKEAEVNEYYKTKLNTLQEEEKIQLAEALKQWYAKHKKWEGKQSPKQAEKVANLKRILGEK